MVVKENCGLKGGEARIARSEMAITSAEFNGILITQLARTPK
jgi:hypothetical protein